jgi:hypothetical protein
MHDGNAPVTSSLRRRIDSSARACASCRSWARSSCPPSPAQPVHAGAQTQLTWATLLRRRGYQHQRQSLADGEHGASIMPAHRARRVRLADGGAVLASLHDAIHLSCQPAGEITSAQAQASPIRPPPLFSHSTQCED